jgi:hypothetical protein
MPLASPDPELRVLQEFRLKAADPDGAVARIVAASAGGESAVPLLVSIDDPRDVATLRQTGAPGSDLTTAERTERAALAPLVESWKPRAWYRPRVAETSRDPAHRYRMAVTGSGINDARADIPARGAPAPTDPSAASRIADLWIGEPVDTHAGLLVLIGHYRGGVLPDARPDSWPRDLSRKLGVRIYDSLGSKVEAA